MPSSIDNIPPPCGCDSCRELDRISRFAPEGAPIPAHGRSAMEMQMMEEQANAYSRSELCMLCQRMTTEFWAPADNYFHMYRRGANEVPFCRTCLQDLNEQLHSNPDPIRRERHRIYMEAELRTRADRWIMEYRRTLASQFASEMRPRRGFIQEHEPFTFSFPLDDEYVKLLEQEKQKAAEKKRKEAKSMEANSKSCANCEAETDTRFEIVNAPGFYCQSCLDAHARVCVNCDDYHMNGSVVVVTDRHDDEHYMCTKCFRAGNAFNCNDCGARRMNECDESGGDHFCNDCIDNWTRCDQCSAYARSDSLYFDEDEDQYICNSCHGERNADRWQHDQWKMGDATMFEQIKSNRRFGIELECQDFSGVKKDKTVFSCVDDGSVKGGEFVSPVLQGDEGLAAIKELCEAGDFEVDDNCGFHLHMDMREVPAVQVAQIGRGYKLMEDFLFCLMPRSRQDNHYCKKIETDYSNVKTEKELAIAVYGGRYSREEIRRSVGKYHDKRYEFLNMHSYFYRQTLEVRLHSGTFQVSKIKNWINFNLGLVEIFLKHEPFVLTISDVLHKLFEYDISLKAYCKSRLEKYKVRGYEKFLAMVEEPSIEEVPQTPLKEFSHVSRLIDRSAITVHYRDGSTLDLTEEEIVNMNGRTAAILGLSPEALQAVTDATYLPF